MYQDDYCYSNSSHFYPLERWLLGILQCLKKTYGSLSLQKLSISSLNFNHFTVSLLFLNVSFYPLSFHFLLINKHFFSIEQLGKHVKTAR